MSSLTSIQGFILCLGAALFIWFLMKAVAESNKILKTNKRKKGEARIKEIDEVDKLG